MKKRIHNLMGPLVLIVLFTASAQAQRVMPYYDGITDGSHVNTMVEYNGQLVIGGRFNAFYWHARNGLQGWDGATLYDYPGAFESSLGVNAMVVFNGDLVVAGFDTTYQGIARWDGSGWHAMGMEFPNGGIKALCVHAGALYAAGTQSTSPLRSRVKRWTGDEWVPVGAEFKGTVSALETYEGRLYAGGTFNQEATMGGYLRRLATWNPWGWMAVAQGLNNDVSALLATPTGMVVGGTFTALGDGTLSLPGWTVFTDGFFGGFAEPSVVPEHVYGPPVYSIVAHPISGFILSGGTNTSIWVDGPAVSEIHFGRVRAAVQYGGEILLGGMNGGSFMPVKGVCKLVEGTDLAYLDIGNIRAGVAPNSKLFHNNRTNRPAFRAPRSGDVHSIRAVSPWLMGMHGGASHSAAPYGADQLASQAGPHAVWMDADFQERYHQVWKLDQGMIAYHADHWQDPDYEVPYAIRTWPGNGRVANGEPARIAPFADLNGNDLYEPLAGEYPLIRGDQAIYSILHSIPSDFWVYPLMDLDIGIMVYAFDDSTNADIYNTVFTNFTIINRGSEDYTDVRFGLYTDLELGNADDDHYGCDSLQSLHYVYNADDLDETAGLPGYGAAIPAQGAMFLNSEMNSFTAPVINSSLPDHMNGTQLGAPFMQTGYPSHFQYPGGAFTQEAAGELPQDRGSIGSIGPLTLNMGDTLCVDMAFPFALAPSGNRLESLDALILRSAAIHAWYATQDVNCDEIPNLIAHVKEATRLEMALYPVPAQDQVMVRCPQLNSGAELQLLNGMGQVVRTLAWPAGREEIRVDLNGVPNGLYIVRLSNASDRLTRSLVVVH